MIYSVFLNRLSINKRSRCWPISLMGLFFLGGGLHACQQVDRRADIETIRIDFEQVTPVDLNQGQVIPLETSDKALIAQIDRVVFAENRFFIQSRKNILAFDSVGNYLFHVGRVGRGPNEYLSVNSFFERDDELCVYDWNARKIVAYNMEGQCEGGQTIEVRNVAGVLSPSNILPLSNGNYIAQNTFRGEGEATPEFSLLDGDLNYIGDYNGLEMVSGANHPDLLIGPQNTLIYNRMFADTLYRIGALPNVEAAYYVDFGAHTLPNSLREGKDYADLILESGTPEFIDNIATLIRYRYETDNKLMFIFAFRLGVHFVVYDKTTKQTRTFRFVDAKGKYKPEMFIAYQNDAIYIAASLVNDLEANPVLIRFNASLFGEL